jgi:SRSO17 transposase
MDIRGAQGSESRFAKYVQGLVSVIGHADRARPLWDYCVGLMVTCERKSVEPMAAVTAPERVSAQHQSLLHFVNQAPWSDEKVLAKVREMVVPQIERHGPIEAWIIDDTGLPKKGRHSVGVGRQYCGQVGKQDNCQVAVSLSIANHHDSLPVAYRLYLTKDWAEDSARRRKAGVPDDIVFKTKPQIALDQLRFACAAGIARGVVLMDPAYGNDAALRMSTTALGLIYVAGIQSNVLVWAPGSTPQVPLKQPQRGRNCNPGLISVKEVALGLSRNAWRTIKWREGTNDWLSSRFARLRVQVGHRHQQGGEPTEEWLLIEWPKGEDAPTKYWLSTLPANISFRDLVDITKLRWRIERDYQELKQEVGLGHYEGRGWRGFHHHATLCIAAYGFLLCERETIPPSGPAAATLLPQPAVPDGYRPRGSAVAAATPRPELGFDHAPISHRRARRDLVTMSVLCDPDQPKNAPPEFVMQ